MKHIMMISNSFGSLYNFRYELILELLERYQVTLVTPMDDQDRKHYQVFKKKGCHLIETPLERRGRNPLKELSLYNTYREILKKKRPDLVMTYTIKPNTYAGMAAAARKIPYIATVTGLGTAFEKEGILKRLGILLYKKGLKKCGAVFFQNRESMEAMRGYGIIKENYRLVPGSGINLEKFYYCDYPEEETYLFMARIQKAKGAEEFFEAAARLKEKYPSVAFDVVGFCEEAYEDRIKQLQDDGIIRYYGWRDDPETFFRKAACLIQPSYHEGMSNACLEAAATGRPMIVSDIPGCREAVEDGINGYVFPVKDAEGLYGKMQQFHLLPREEKVRMGRKGREKMEREFDRKIVMGKYLEEIERLGRTGNDEE